MAKTILDLEAEMRAVASGTLPAPAAALREPALDPFAVLTAFNRTLLGLIGREAPANVSDLATQAGRAQSNVSRGLQELAAAGLVRLVRDGTVVRPELTVRHIDIDLVTNRWQPVEVDRPLPAHCRRT